MKKDDEYGNPGKLCHDGRPNLSEVLKAHFAGKARLELPELKEGRRVFLSADHHLFHSNILKHCPERGRLFAAVEEMNDYFLQLHNLTVGDKDTVVIVGDYIWRGRGGNPKYDESPLSRLEEMKAYTKMLKGKKYLIRGNHDKFTDEEYLEGGFEGCGHYAVLSAQGGDATIIHSPREIISLWYSAQGAPGYFDDVPMGYRACFDDILTIPGRYLCGHIHQMWRRLGPFVNVGLDVWDMAPVSLEDALGAFGQPSEILSGKDVDRSGSD